MDPDKVAIVVAVAVGLVIGPTGCSPLPPPYHDARYGLEYPGGSVDTDERVSITAIEQQTEGYPASEEIPANLIVDVTIGPDNARNDWTLERSDIELVAGVPEGHRLIADDRAERRVPDELSVRRDGDWVEAESLSVAADESLDIRVRFDGFLPYIEPQRGDTRYYQPVDLQLSVPDPGAGTAELVLTDAGGDAPVWTRQSLDSRFFMGIHGTIGLFDRHHGSPGFGTTSGAHFQFTNDFYVRPAIDIGFGALLRASGQPGEYTSGSTHMRNSAKLTAGYNFDLPTASVATGVGWAVSHVMRFDTARLNFPHRGVAEVLVVREAPRAYPYRTSDFHGDFGVYMRFMPRLGNFGEAEAEAPGFVATMGFVFQPAAF